MDSWLLSWFIDGHVQYLLIPLSRYDSRFIIRSYLATISGSYTQLPIIYDRTDVRVALRCDNLAKSLLELEAFINEVLLLINKFVDKKYLFQAFDRSTDASTFEEYMYNQKNEKLCIFWKLIIN